MKKIFFAIVAVAMVMTSCSIHFKDSKDTKDAKEKVTKTLNLKDFTRIQVSGSADIEFTQDSVFKVEVTCTNKALENAEIKVEDGTLVISSKKNNKFFNNSEEYDLRISAPMLNSVSVAGACDFDADNITADDFSASIAGAGAFDIEKLKANNVSFSISGAGDIEAFLDNCGSVDVTVAGAGNVDLRGQVHQLNKHVSGMADVNTNKLLIK